MNDFDPVVSFASLFQSNIHFADEILPTLSIQPLSDISSYTSARSKDLFG